MIGFLATIAALAWTGQALDPPSAAALLTDNCDGLCADPSGGGSSTGDAGTDPSTGDAGTDPSTGDAGTDPPTGHGISGAPGPDDPDVSQLPPDPDEYSNPVTEKPSPFFDPPKIYLGDSSMLSSDMWSHSIKFGKDVYVWPNPVVMCDSFMRSVGSGEAFLARAYRRLDRMAGQFLAIDPHTDRSRKILARENVLVGRIGDAETRTETYLGYYDKKDCDSVYASAAGF
jgi:hypothetical protein